MSKTKCCSLILSPQPLFLFLRWLGIVFLSFYQLYFISRIPLCRWPSFTRKMQGQCKRLKVIGFAITSPLFYPNFTSLLEVISYEIFWNWTPDIRLKSISIKSILTSFFLKIKLYISHQNTVPLKFGLNENYIPGPCSE